MNYISIFFPPPGALNGRLIIETIVAHGKTNGRKERQRWEPPPSGVTQPERQVRRVAATAPSGRPRAGTGPATGPATGK